MNTAHFATSTMAPSVRLGLASSPVSNNLHLPSVGRVPPLNPANLALSLRVVSKPTQILFIKIFRYNKKRLQLQAFLNRK